MSTPQTNERKRRASMRTTNVRRTSATRTTPLASLQVGAYYHVSRHSTKWYPYRYTMHQGKRHLICRSNEGTYTYVLLPIDPSDWRVDK